jgi:dipeptidyl aminopeptidase/acylaminoacyl peptidase
MKKIQLDDFIQFKFIGNLKSSPNKKTSAFILSQANIDENTYHHSLYVYDQNGAEKRRFLKKNSDFVFLNDEVILLDYQKNQVDRDQLDNHQRKQFYQYHIKDRQIKKAFSLPINGKVEAVIDESTLLISANLTVEDHILYMGKEEDRKLYLENKENKKLYEDIDQIPYYFNERGFFPNQKKQIFIYNIQTNQLKPIVEKAFSVENVILSKDKQSIYYSGKYAEKVMSFTSSIYQYHIQEDMTETLYEKRTHNIVQMFDLGTLVVLAKDMKTYGLNQNPDFFIVDNQSLQMIQTFGQSFGNTIGTDCRLLGNPTYLVKDKTLYFTSTVDDHCEILKFSMNGALESVFKMNGSIDGLIENQGNIYFVGMEKQGLQELYWMKDFDSIEKVTSFNEDVLKNKYIAQPLEVKIIKQAHDIKGFVLLPEGYNPNKKYPMILDIHGGPKTVYGQIYYHEMQYWVNLGYVVAFANPRGSDGKGNVFADIRGKYGSIDYDDLMDFTDQVLEDFKGIDPNRLYVTGGSYGGFMTNWIVGHTQRFRAAVTQRSISNWLSFYGTSDIGYYFASDQTDGHPLIDMDKLYHQSPIKYAMDVQTPLLFIHSDKDLRCPIEQAQQFYAVLKTRGIDTEFKWFKEETHELSRSGKPQARIKRLEDITEWFEKH